MSFPENNFKCALCGECCSGDMKVFLNPFDLKKMVQASGLSSNQELLDKGLIILDKGQHGVLLPRIKFKETSGLSFCPFLENRIEPDGNLKGLCRLHPDRKPLVCALAPFARELELETGESCYYFQKPITDCPGCNVKEPFRLRELFPQVEHELQIEGDFLKSLKILLDRGISSEEILERLFHLRI